MALSSTKPRLVSIPHPRCEWRGDEKVFVSTSWGRLKGTDERALFRIKSEEDYKKAKQEGDFEAGARIVRGFIRRDKSVLDKLVDVVTPIFSKGIPLLCVVPHPSFDDEDGSQPDVAQRVTPRNVLPQSFAAVVAEELGASMDEEILEKERVGRTRLNSMERFIWQPSFTGSVRQDVRYVIVDDVLTLGGTIAALRSYILSKGGTVAAAATLAHRQGEDQQLALSPTTWDDLTALFGAALDDFWKEEVGHGANCLTEAEGEVLIAWARKEFKRSGQPPLLHQLRACLFEATAKNR